MKRIITTLFCSAVLLSAFAATDEVAVADTNRDGLVNTADAELIYSYILGTADEGVTAEQVDVNSDGIVNTADVVAVYVAMNTPEKPEEGGMMGDDTYDDFNFGE